MITTLINSQYMKLKFATVIKLVLSKTNTVFLCTELELFNTFINGQFIF